MPLGIAEQSGESGQPESLTDVRVLVVEDHDTTRRVLHEQLTAWGMRPQTVATADDALRALEMGATGGDPYTWVLVDSRLSTMDGLDLGRRICRRADSAGVRMVLMTSDAEIGLEKSRAAGFGTSLVKPERLSDLRTAFLNPRGTRLGVQRRPDGRTQPDPGSTSGRIPARDGSDSHQGTRARG